ncbi:EPIDERMAL PATTERNING FACTOR-like protein 5 [Hibiscus syriacus]|uniref:EPIDERMAL PATTERNING FACTOR-like protein 5 n=1 Tax=Hibiscus syriacus TaxID=106335 RepID=A0A6A3A2L6_HIBSY|nr:EPIDERMAL PATTERNING FACTOR-like protein 5 [Hibiscus syriacus]
MGVFRQHYRRRRLHLHHHIVAALTFLLFASASARSLSQLGNSFKIPFQLEYSCSNPAIDSVETQYSFALTRAESEFRVREGSKKRSGSEVTDRFLSQKQHSGPGSQPPSCRSSCGSCSPCKPVHVPIQPSLMMPLEYYPEAWRCKFDYFHGSLGSAHCSQLVCNAIGLSLYMCRSCDPIPIPYLVRCIHQSIASIFEAQWPTKTTATTATDDSKPTLRLKRECEDDIHRPIIRFWSPPAPLGLVKVNFDGSFNPSLGRGRVGCVLRNSVGQFLSACPRCIIYAMDVFHVESLACHEGLLLAVSLGCQRIIVEGDSCSVICRASTSMRDDSYGSLILDHIRALSQPFDICSFQHIGRFGNAVADAVAREGLSSGSSLHWNNSPLPLVISLIAADMVS